MSLLMLGASVLVFEVVAGHVVEHVEVEQRLGGDVTLVPGNLGVEFVDELRDRFKPQRDGTAVGPQPLLLGDGEHGVAVETFTVEPSRGRWPASAKLSNDLASVMAGTLDVDEQLAARAHTYRNASRALVAQLVSTQVTFDNFASASATVVEVRAEDTVGQLHRITRALVECHLDVTSAKVSTFGSAVVDAFYVRGPDGHKLTEPAQFEAVEAAIHAHVATSTTA